jgi:hypothetical protein
MSEDYFYYWKKDDLKTIFGVIVILIISLGVIIFVAEQSHNIKDDFCKQEKISGYIDYDTCYDNYNLIKTKYDEKQEKELIEIIEGIE